MPSLVGSEMCIRDRYQALGVYLPLITTNCAVLGVALTNVQKEYNVLQGTVNGFATAVGFTICLLYTSDAADDLLCVDFAGRRTNKKKNKNKYRAKHRN